MASGDALLPRPHAVPIRRAHDQITDNVRRTPSGFRLDQADDVSSTPPTSRQHYVYDTTTGLLVPVPPDPVSFVWSTLVVQVSPGWQSNDSGGNITGIALLLTTAGTSTTTAQLRKNGSVIGSTGSLTTGQNTMTPVIFTTPVAFGGPFTDYLQAEITAIGTGAAGLTVSALRG